MSDRRRCAICRLTPAEHGPTQLGRVYAAPVGWHRHTAEGSRAQPYTPPPPGYRPRRVDLATPAFPDPDPRDSFIPWKRKPNPDSAPVSLEPSREPNQESEPVVVSDPLPRPVKWWGSWRLRRSP